MRVRVRVRWRESESESESEREKCVGEGAYTAYKKTTIFTLDV